MQKYLWLSLLIISSIFYACLPTTTSIQKRFITNEDIQFIPTEFNAIGDRNPCLQASNYAPDTNYLDHYSVKLLRVNVHFMNGTSGKYNYEGEEAIKFANGLINTANGDLKKNYKMLLPQGNDTPVLPILYQYKLVNKPSAPNEKAIYFHYDDECAFYIHKGKNRNIYDKTVLNRYGVEKDSVLNIFIMPHHPDSVKSKTYNTAGVGVAPGNYFKLAGPFETKKKYWEFKGVFNHEVGHVLTLAHSWRGNDGCDDTPTHPNCFHYTTAPKCDSLTSNNVMDYNAWQHAYTPCQIGRIHLSIAKENSRQRKLFWPRWCEINPNKNIVIQDKVDWNCMKDLEGHLRIESGGVLTMRCRTSLPKGAKITIAAGGKLILDNARLHNACGDEWEGIELEKSGKTTGEVVFIGKAKLENVRNGVELPVEEGL